MDPSFGGPASPVSSYRVTTRTNFDIDIRASSGAGGIKHKTHAQKPVMVTVTVMVRMDDG